LKKTALNDSILIPCVDYARITAEQQRRYECPIREQATASAQMPFICNVLTVPRCNNVEPRGESKPD